MAGVRWPLRSHGLASRRCFSVDQPIDEDVRLDPDDLAKHRLPEAVSDRSHVLQSTIFGRGNRPHNRRCLVF